MSEIETLHMPFSRFLREQGIPFIRARSDRESTIELGHPDFTILKNGAALMIEFKMPKSGRLSQDQNARIGELNDAGNKVFVLRDLATAMEMTLAWSAQLGAAHALAGNVAQTPGRLSIRNVPGSGDYVFDGEKQLRRALVSDLDLRRTFTDPHKAQHPSD